MKTPTRLACSLLVLAACDDDSTSPPAPPGVTGSEQRLFLGIDGTQRPRPVDLSRAIVAALVPREDGGWDEHAGYGELDGRLVVPDAPAGDHWLRVDRFDPDPEAGPRDEYLWTDAAEVDYGVAQIGRPDFDHAATTTPLLVDATGLSAWADGDLLCVHDPNLGYVNFSGEAVPGQLDNFPVAGATSVSGLRFDWGLYQAPLADAGLGDQRMFIQYRRFPIGDFSYFAPLTSFTASLTQADGESTHVTGSFAPGEPLTYRLAWKRSAYEAMRAEIHPSAGASAGHGFALLASPGVTDAGWHWKTLPMEIVSLDPAAVRGTDDLDLGDLVAQTPFPRSTHYSFHEVAFPVEMTLNGFATTYYARIGQLETRFPSAAEPTVPLVSPVRAPTIGGRDLFVAQADVGPSPTISWQAPAVGTPSSYLLRFGMPGGGDPELGVGWWNAATLIVPGDVTSVRVPEGVLQEGREYVVVIRAVVQEGVDVRVAPYRRSLPHAYADAVSAPISP